LLNIKCPQLSKPKAKGKKGDSMNQPGVWTVQELQFFGVIGDGSIVPAAESALQRFIHAFFCCPARDRERGE